MIIGLTGGVGTGKTTILEYLKNKHNAVVIEADKVAHNLMMPEGECYRRILCEFGEEILSEDGSIDRKKLGSVTFNNPEKLKLLSAIVHPEVKHWIIEKIHETTKFNPDRMIVIEAALLIEAGYESICDEMWCVITDYETRKKRLMNSRGYSARKIDEIIANQLNDEEFKKHCDYVIENSNGVEGTYEQIEKILEF